MSLRFAQYPLLLLLALLLTACHDGQQMRQALSDLQARNQADSLLTDDSLALALTQYFDRHGTPNERMEAYYLLGRTYADRGEAPQAIAAYQTAAEQADTTAPDCDYRLLCRVYSQMGWVYHQQLLFAYEIQAGRMATKYAFLAGDTLMALQNIRISAGTYVLMNQRDSAEVAIRMAMQCYREHFQEQEALLTSVALMHLYSENANHQDELGALINAFEEKSDFFDKHHELPSNLRQYYYYKGRNFENNGLLDSAEHNYRKVFHPNMTFMEQEPMYKGLLSIFKRRHLADSIAKYAQLYCVTNDSTVAIKDQELTAQLTASYQYGAMQKLAMKKEREANRAKTGIVILLLLMAIVAASLIVYRKQQSERVARLKAEYADAVNRYRSNLQALQVLEASHQAAIDTIQEELDREKAENKATQRLRLLDTQKMGELTNEYESCKERLTLENQQLQARIKVLEAQCNIPQKIEHLQLLTDTKIVHRIMEMRNRPQSSLTAKEKKTLFTVMGQFYPDLIGDLNHTNEVTTLGTYVCILVALKLHSGEIANMLNIKDTQVANLKQDVNNALFHDNTARTLYKNLVKRYGLYSC